MAGTDQSRERLSGGPAIVLVEPQLGENIGAAARAMFNCGLTDMRLVKPRDPWPNEKAVAAASGADPVLDGARLYERVEDAIADLNHVYVTTARDRYMVKRVLTPRAAAAEMREKMAEGNGCGVLFGPERTGLFNDAIALGDRVIRVPLNPAFSSLNLAQAVLLIGYEWFQAADGTPPNELIAGHSRPASKEELQRFFDHFEEALDQSGFLRTADKRPGMVRNLRNLFQRAECTEQELRTLHGVVAAFVGARAKRPGSELSDDTLVEGGLIALAVAHVGALGIALIRRRSGPLRLANLLFSLGVVLWWLPSLGRIVAGDYVDFIPLWLGFELIVLIASGAAVAGIRVPSVVTAIAFAAHLLLTAAGLAFMFTFSMRMI